MCFTNPNLLTHVILTPPDPNGQDATAGPVGLYVGGSVFTDAGKAKQINILGSRQHLAEKSGAVVRIFYFYFFSAGRIAIFYVCKCAFNGV